MTFVKLRPAHATHFNPFFDKVWGNGLADFRGNESINNIPAVNISEDDHAFNIELAAPGLTKDRFSLNLKANAQDRQVLTIKAEKVTPEPSADQAATIKQTISSPRYTRHEFNYNGFERSFTLPTTVDPDGITASYQDGVLLVRIPKREEAKANFSRTIAVK